MHEAGLTKEMLNAVLEASTQAGINEIERINLGLGNISHVTPESVIFYFEAFSKGTAAEGAELSFREVAGGESHYFQVESVEGV